MTLWYPFMPVHGIGSRTRPADGRCSIMAARCATFRARDDSSRVQRNSAPAETAREPCRKVSEPLALHPGADIQFRLFICDAAARLDHRSELTFCLDRRAIEIGQKWPL